MKPLHMPCPDAAGVHVAVGIALGIIVQELRDIRRHIQILGIVPVKHIGTAYPKLYVNNPDAQMWFTYGFTNKATGEDVAIATSGFNGLVAFPKIANPTDVNLKQCLDFCGKITSDAAAEIFSWGAEGYTYSIDENSHGVRSQEQYDEFYSTYTTVSSISSASAPPILWRMV